MNLEELTERDVFREELVECFRVMSIMFDFNDPEVRRWTIEELTEFVSDLHDMNADEARSDWVTRALAH